MSAALISRAGVGIGQDGKYYSQIDIGPFQTQEAAADYARATNTRIAEAIRKDGGRTIDVADIHKGSTTTN